MNHRESVATARRVVVKIGTAALGPRVRDMAANVSLLADIVCRERDAGREFVVVSSGAVQAGRLLLGDEDGRTGVRTAACVGQPWLTEHYRKEFARRRLTIAQLLVPNPPPRSLALGSTLLDLLGQDCVPILNENDSLANGSFGNNDELSAHVADVIGAELVVFVTDVPGILVGPADAWPVRVTAELSVDDSYRVVRPCAPSLRAPGRGGIAAKLAAARSVARHGIPVVVGGLLDLLAILGGAEAGTLIPPAARASGRDSGSGAACVASPCPEETSESGL